MKPIIEGMEESINFIIIIIIIIIVIIMGLLASRNKKFCSPVLKPCFSLVRTFWIWNASGHNLPQ